MAVLKGCSGSIKWNNQTVSQMTNWNLDIKSDYLESTEFGDSWREFQGGLLSFSGSAAGKFDKSDANGHLAIQTAALGGTSATVKFDLDGTSYFSGVCLVTASLNAAVDKAVEVTYNFQGSGSLTYHAS